MVKFFVYDDISYKIGENANDNNELIQSVDSNYYWLHMNDFPSPHVIICKNILTENAIHIATKLCVLYGKKKYKHLKSFNVIITKINNLLLTDIPGEVEFKSEGKRNLYIKNIKLDNTIL